MATQSRRKSTSVSERLFKEPFRFSFFQATRLLQGLVRQWQKKGKCGFVGRDLTPEHESVRFSPLLSLQFASTEVAKIQKHQRLVKSEQQEIAEMQVSFFGLTGQSSVLPVYFTELQLQRLREKDTALRDFLDIFNHRSISFFYRAWEKYRLPFNYERVHLLNHNQSQQQTDPITQTFESLLGFSAPAIRKQLPLRLEEMIYYAGLYATQRRSASALEASLVEYMGIPITVNQFKGEWMSLSEDDRCQLPFYPLAGKNNCLGIDTVIGDQVYTMEGKFEIILGPLNKQDFENIMPGSERIKALDRFVRMYVGGAQHFELKYQLKEDSVSEWILDEELDASRRLGWNTWLKPKNKADSELEMMADVRH